MWVKAISRSVASGVATGLFAATLLVGAFVLGQAAAAEERAAQEVEPVSVMNDIAPEEWRDMVLGRTVTYRIGHDLWAREAYDIKSNGVAIRLADGTCMEGIWTWDEGAYCFYWSSGEISCFRHVRAGGEILIIPLVDGEPSGTVQTVDGVSDAPLACGPALVS